MPLLTVRAIDAHKPKPQPYKLTLDRGLQLRVAPDGARTLLIWSPLSTFFLSLLARWLSFEFGSLRRCDTSVAATMNQTHIRGLVTSTSSIRRGPASL